LKGWVIRATREPHLPLPVLLPKPKTSFRPKLLSLCEQRSGETRFSIGALPEATHSIAFAIAAIYFSPFSAQKSHVKPRDYLNHTNKTRSSWHFSFI
jgi:hypothetical protein